MCGGRTHVSGDWRPRRDGRPLADAHPHCRSHGRCAGAGLRRCVRRFDLALRAPGRPRPDRPHRAAAWAACTSSAGWTCAATSQDSAGSLRPQRLGRRASSPPSPTAATGSPPASCATMHRPPRGPDRRRAGTAPRHEGPAGQGEWRDAEALERLPGGDWLVSFEQRHRVWRYAAETGGCRVAPCPSDAEGHRGRARQRRAGGAHTACRRPHPDAGGEPQARRRLPRRLARRRGRRRAPRLPHRTRLQADGRGDPAQRRRAHPLPLFQAARRLQGAARADSRAAPSKAAPC